jgi:hypothetical protein
MSESMWDFPPGTVSHDQSLKGYHFEVKDGDGGVVSWCDYAPGESYLVVTWHAHLGGKHHVVPAGLVSSVDHEKRIVKLDLTLEELAKRPDHEEPSQPIDRDDVDRFEIGLLHGYGVTLVEPPPPE